MEIKRLELDDIGLMEDVMKDDHMIFSEEYLRNFINDDHNHGFIVKGDESIVGFAYAYGLLRPDGKRMLYLHSIGLLPEHQGKGLGTKLLGYIIEYARENGFSECFVITDKGNERACHVYEKLGGKNDYEDEIVYVYNFEKQEELS